MHSAEGVAEDTNAGAGAEAMIALRGVHLRYGRAPWILRDLDLDVAPGERLLLRGANGAGKSTLLRILAGELRPSQGQRRCAPGLSCASLAQDSRPDWTLPITCGEVVAAGWRAACPWWWPRGSGRRAAVHAALDAVGLAQHAQRPPGELSGGQGRRLVIARALVQQAQVLLWDEPLSGLDATARQDLAQVLHRITGPGKVALVMTSHEVADFPLPFDRDLHFHAGRLVPTTVAHCSLAHGAA